jgi:predicted RNase H-like nuclease (RuvC/YqgF family)
MSSGPTQKDTEIRAAIDELNEAVENTRRAREEVERWQRENPRPEQPQSVQSMAEVERFERRSEEWNKPYIERRERLEQAEEKLQAAHKKATVTAPTAHWLRIQGKGISARWQ